jgi:hypothetical protein
MTVRRVAIAASVVAAVFVAGLIAGLVVASPTNPRSSSQPTASTTSPSTTRPRPSTLMRRFDPFGPDVTVTGTVSGYCRTNSSIVWDTPAAWRCMSGVYIHDPCFSSATSTGGTLTSVRCINDPWSGAQIMNLTQPLPPADTGNPIPAPGKPYDWALELANGARCTVRREMTPSVAGVYMTYGCDYMTSGRQASQAGMLDPGHSPWTVQYNAPGSSALAPMDIAVAWKAD